MINRDPVYESHNDWSYIFPIMINHNGIRKRDYLSNMKETDGKRDRLNQKKTKDERTNFSV